METLNITNRLWRACVLLVVSGIMTVALAQEGGQQQQQQQPAQQADPMPNMGQAQRQIDQAIQGGVQRTQESAASQTRIDQTATETDKLVAEYKRLLKVNDGLRTYNALLQRQLDDQQTDMNNLRRSIDEVAIIERQITPTMLRMLESLDIFIKNDVPFLLDERNNRVQRLRDAVASADITTAEKFRAVLEAFNIVGNYGRTIEAYTGSLPIDGVNREVNFLKIGRISLIYQTADRETNGVWDQANREWVQLTNEEFRNYIAQGLQIAREQVAPDILMIPIVASEIE